MQPKYSFVGLEFPSELGQPWHVTLTIQYEDSRGWFWTSEAEGIQPVAVRPFHSVRDALRGFRSVFPNAGASAWARVRCYDRLRTDSLRLPLVRAEGFRPPGWHENPDGTWTEYRVVGLSIVPTVTVLDPAKYLFVTAVRQGDAE